MPSLLHDLFSPLRKSTSPALGTINWKSLFPDPKKKLLSGTATMCKSTCSLLSVMQLQEANFWDNNFNKEYKNIFSFNLLVIYLCKQMLNLVVRFLINSGMWQPNKSSKRIAKKKTGVVLFSARNHRHHPSDEVILKRPHFQEIHGSSGWRTLPHTHLFVKCVVYCNLKIDGPESLTHLDLLQDCERARKDQVGYQWCLMITWSRLKKCWVTYNVESAVLKIPKFLAMDLQHVVLFTPCLPIWEIAQSFLWNLDADQPSTLLDSTFWRKGLVA